MGLFDKIINVGITKTTAVIEERNIQLTNFISICLGLALSTILTVRYLTAPFYIWFYAPLTIQILFFFAIVAINKKGLTTASRLLVCWIPSIALFIDFQILITHVP